MGAFLVANVAAQLSGGWDEVFDRSHPLPGDPEVVAARAVGARPPWMPRSLGSSTIAGRPALTGGRVAQPALAGAEAMTEAVRARLGCEVGSHNWKRDDPYDLLCSEVRRAIVAGDAASFRADMLALDRP